MSTVIRAEDLCVTLKIPRRPEKELVRHVNFEVQRGECLGILGESGSGKSMSIKAMLGLLDKNFSVSGHAWFGEKDLLKESGESMRKIRGSKIAVVLQNPMTCFEPTLPDWKPDRGDICDTHGLECERDPREVTGDTGTHADPQSGGDASEIPASALRRHAAEDHDRDRDGIKTGTSDRG